MTTKEEQIRLNIDCLDIQLIHNVMQHLNLKINGQQPTLKEIERVAIFCMNKSYESENKFFSVGGFEAEVIDGVIGIRFVLTQANPLSVLLG